MEPFVPCFYARSASCAISIIHTRRNGLMDSRDEEFTLENVDEQVEQLLVRLQTSHPPKTFMARTIRNLQSLYEEDRRLENAWARINNAASTLNLHNALRETDEPIAIRPVPEEKNAWQESTSVHVGSFDSVPRRPARQPQQPRRWGQRNLGIVLVAAIVLIIIFALPVFSYAFRDRQPAGSRTSTKTATPPARPTGNIPPMKEYVNQYFTIQYPANWVISDTTTGGTGPYLQTVQFRPAATSS